jgi:hypothetical protein
MPFSTKADFARSNADHIAIAADLGFITTRALDGEYARQWFATPKGLTMLWRNRKES